MTRRGTRGGGKRKPTDTAPASSSSRTPAVSASGVQQCLQKSIEAIPEYHPRIPVSKLLLLPTHSRPAAEEGPRAPSALPSERPAAPCISGGALPSSHQADTTTTTPSATVDVSATQRAAPIPPPPPPPYPHAVTGIGVRSGRPRRGGPPSPPPPPPTTLSHRSGQQPRPQAAADAFSETALSQELMAFTAYVGLTPHEHAERAMLIHTVASCAADLWPTWEEAEAKTEVRVNERTPVATADAHRVARGSSSHDDPFASCPRHSPPRRRIVVCRDVVVYGSYALGLSLPTSDVDMCVALGLPPSAMPAACADGSSREQPPPAAHGVGLESGGHDSPQAAAASREGSCCSTVSIAHLSLMRQQRQLEALYDLADHFLLCHGAWLRLEVHDQCRVPVIKLCDTRTGVCADVTVSIRLPVPTARTTLEGTARPRFYSLPVEDVVRRQCAWLRSQEPAGHPAHASVSMTARSLLSDARVFAQLATMLILVTKAALRQWGLNNVFAGGVSSTALYSLVRRYLHTNGISRAREAPGMTASCTPKPTTLRVFASTGSKDGGGEAEAEAEEGSEEDGCTLAHSPTTSHAPGISDFDECTATAPPSSAASSITQGGQDESEEDGEDEGSRTTARSTPVPVPLRNGERGEDDAVPSDVPSLSAAEILTGCATLFGVSPARLLLNFWRSLSADVYLFGYNVVDAFAAEDADGDGHGGEAAAPHADRRQHAGEVCAEANTDEAPAAMESAANPVPAAESPAVPLYDLTAPSFRLPELLALFRCSCTKLENEVTFEAEGTSSTAIAVAARAAIRARRAGCGARAATPLSLVLVDPRSLQTSANCPMPYP